ncbi:MAG TPA: hypothetical protein VFR41_05210 [Acidimicrobiia bacterium]|nr:hypothetical protein [Acidimicrobiia bacterium]
MAGEYAARRPGGHGIALPGAVHCLESYWDANAANTNKIRSRFAAFAY